MLLVGLTGGIGSGKSTVSALLAERGAILIDADVIARQIVEPGEETWTKIIEHFGPDILRADQSIDREELARIVFSDPHKRVLLNELTHPKVMSIIAGRLEELRSTNAIVVADIPLLTETAGAKEMFEIIVVVEASPQVRAERLGADRGMAAEDVLARIASQASDTDRRAVADLVINNDGDRDALQVQIEDLWTTLVERRAESESA